MSRAVTARRSFRFAAIAACLLAGGTGCTSGEGGTAAPSPNPPPRSSSGGAAQRPQSLPPVAPTSSGGPCRHIQSAGTRPVARPERGANAVLGVRIERHSCSDWVIFRLSGAARTGADVGYAAGTDTTLRIALHAPAATAVRPIWKAGKALTPVPAGTQALRRVSWTGNAGKDSVFTVATTGKLPFAISWRPAAGGSELVLEIAHQAVA